MKYTILDETLSLSLQLTCFKFLVWLQRFDFRVIIYLNRNLPLNHLVLWSSFPLLLFNAFEFAILGMLKCAFRIARMDKT